MKALDVRQIRGGLGLSQSEFAERYQISFAYAAAVGAGAVEAGWSGV